jgi:hypothetical protein
MDREKKKSWSSLKTNSWKKSCIYLAPPQGLTSPKGISYGLMDKKKIREAKKNIKNHKYIKKHNVMFEFKKENWILYKFFYFLTPNQSQMDAWKTCFMVQWGWIEC